jgi:hypothetical protein
MYSGGRYFTINGHRLQDGPSEIGERTAELADLYFLVFGEGKPLRHKDAFPKRPEDRDAALSALEGLSPSFATNYAQSQKRCAPPRPLPPHLGGRTSAERTPRIAA